MKPLLRFLPILVASMVVAAGCGEAGNSVESLESPGSSGAAVETPEPSTASPILDVAAPGTTVANFEAIYGLFVEAWNGVYETGSSEQIHLALHPESLNLYGEDACVEYIQSQDRIPDGFRVFWQAVPAEGFTQVELDGVRLAAYLDTRAILEWSGGQFEARWASLLVPDSALGQRGYSYNLVLADCGEPLEGRFPLVLAVHESYGEGGTDQGVTLSLDAPDRWWIEVNAPVTGLSCDVALVDTGSGDTLLSYAAYDDTAAEVTFGGSLQIVALGECPRIRAVTDASLLSTPASDLAANPALIWMPHIHPDGDLGIGETILLVNSGESPGDMTGWALEGGAISYQFPHGFTIDPKQEAYVHARCGTDTHTELHACLEGDVFSSHEITLYDSNGTVIDGFA